MKEGWIYVGNPDVGRILLKRLQSKGMDVSGGPAVGIIVKGDEAYRGVSRETSMYKAFAWENRVPHELTYEDFL